MMAISLIIACLHLHHLIYKLHIYSLFHTHSSTSQGMNFN